MSAYIINQETNHNRLITSTIHQSNESEKKAVSMWDRFLTEKDKQELLRYSQPRQFEDDE